MAETVYNRHKYRVAHGDVNWGGSSPSDLRVLLLETTAAGAYDPDLDDVAALLAVGGVAELTATNYARKAMTSEASAVDDTNNRVNCDADIPVWTALGAATGDAVVAVVVYEEGGGTDGTRYLISYHDTNFPVSLNSGDFTVNTPNDIVRMT